MLAESINRRGPGIADIVSLIRRVSSDPDTDVDRFLDANAFNWLIGALMRMQRTTPC